MRALQSTGRAALGSQVDCDMIMAEGEVVYGAVTDNWPTIEPW